MWCGIHLQKLTLNKHTAATTPHGLSQTDPVPGVHTYTWLATSSPMSVSYRWGGDVGCQCEQSREAHGNKGVGAPWPSQWSPSSLLSCQEALWLWLQPSESQPSLACTLPGREAFVSLPFSPRLCPDSSLYLVSVHSGFCNKNPVVWVAYKQQKFLTVWERTLAPHLRVLREI